MSDIWDEKPSIIPEGYYYNASEMDAWIEKVRKHYDSQYDWIVRLTTENEKLQKNLEAVKTWTEKYQTERYGGYDELRKILGAKE